ncbi:KleE stable inheritance protein [Massilia psychrophila]|uniref:KleE stable inheritance protein n=1 Tax=Massilia psychrophila TaxID=1603353 RepID=UPI0015D51C52|nr:hypothetical protein GCM10008020_39350 [Massilia psychrophila]
MAVLLYGYLGTVSVWPLLRYVVTLDRVFQFFLVLWLWDMPGTFASFTFMAYFVAWSVMAALLNTCAL